MLEYHILKQTHCHYGVTGVTGSDLRPLFTLLLRKFLPNWPSNCSFYFQISLSVRQTTRKYGLPVFFNSLPYFKHKRTCTATPEFFTTEFGQRVSRIKWSILTHLGVWQKSKLQNHIHQQGGVKCCSSVSI